MTWLYRVSDGEAVLYKDIELANSLLDSGEWAESPADCNCEYSCEGAGIGEIAIEDYKGVTVEQFTGRFNKEELKIIANQLNISLKGRITEEHIAKALVDALTKTGE